MQRAGYCALPSGEVAVFSKWEALADLKVRELADHTYYWLDIPGWLPKRSAKKTGENAWSIADKLTMQVLGGSGSPTEGGLIGAAKRDFAAKKGEVMQDSVCVYQCMIPGREPAKVSGSADRLEVGPWIISRAEDGKLNVSTK